MILALALLASASGGAVETGRYRNLFARDHPASTIDTKLVGYWHALFEGEADQRIYHPAAPNGDGPSGYILDTGNGDVRTEGMSYGMMIAVQTNHKAVFDAIWNWTHAHMRYAAGPRAGYFRWRCLSSGCLDDAVPASDGEEYLATALFFAAHRWGGGEGIYDYETQANAILDTMLHKQDMNGGIGDGTTAMFDAVTHQVVFVPYRGGARFTDPSYQLPAFYELWARWARGWRGERTADRAFWRQAASASRVLFARAADARTGLTPDYAAFDGSPHAVDGHGDFRADAYRSAVNWAVDWCWWKRDRAAPSRTERLLAFFAREGAKGYGDAYRIDGTRLSSMPSSALIAANGAAALGAGARGAPFVAALWRLDPPRGRWRYYDGMLQFMAMLHASGRFRAW